jgi:hypothetical protein
MKEKTWDILYMLGMIAMIILFLASTAVFTLSIPAPTEKTELMDTWTVWECDAPHGRYWIDESASGGLTFFKSSSDLKESYTVKYLEGDILRTIIFDSTNPSFLVHLTGNHTMTLEKYGMVWHSGWLGHHETIRGPFTYQLYIPDPNILEATA